MKKKWNFLFFYTWWLIILIGKLIIEKPLILIFSKIPFLDRRWKKVKKYYEKQMYDIDNGFDLRFAFRFMVFSTTLILTILVLLVNYFLNFDVKKYLRIYFWSVIAFSILINYLFLYYNNKYKKYFLMLEKEKSTTRNCLITISFHLGVLVLCILSIIFTVGFNI